DGIRDRTVTGVQTCALPIFAALRANGQARPGSSRFTPEQQLFLSFGQVWCQNATPQERRLRAVTDPHSPGRWRVNGPISDNEDRSEERRVGKEGRARGWGDG